MAFQKIGNIFKIAKSIETNLDEWQSFKTASLFVEEEKTEKVAEKQATEKESNFKVIAEIDPKKFIYIHSTIMAGVNPEENGYWITPDTEKYINDNQDAWTCEDLLKDYKTFKNAMTFVEHVQDIEKARGRCIDTIARKLPDTILIDVLFSVDKKHEDLVDNIKNSIINAVSMGCSTEQTVCSICGHEAKDSEHYCSHLKNNKGQKCLCQDGKYRKAAEICKNNTFYDISLVANPAFAGAIFRKVLSSENVSNHLLANLLNSKIEEYNNEHILKAASKEDDFQITVKNDGSVNIKNAEKEISAIEKLSSDEINNIKSMFNQDTKKTSFINTIINKFFTKDATHPICNESPKKDFTIDWQNYDDIKIRNRHDVLPKVVMITCFNCGNEMDMNSTRKASLISGHYNSIQCDQCFYVHEVPLSKVATKSEQFIERLTELGYPKNIITVLDHTASKIIIAENIEYTVPENTEDRLFTIEADLKVAVDGNDLTPDEDGDSIVGGGETLKMIAKTDDGKIYKTELNENLYLSDDFKGIKKKED